MAEFNEILIVVVVVVVRNATDRDLIEQDNLSYEKLKSENIFQ